MSQEPAKRSTVLVGEAPELAAGLHRYAGDPKFMRLRLLITDHNSLLAKPNVAKVSSEEGERRSSSSSSSSKNNNSSRDNNSNESNGNERKLRVQQDKSNLFYSALLLRRRRSNGRWIIEPEEIEKCTWLESSGLRLKVVSRSSLTRGSGDNTTRRPHSGRTKGDDEEADEWWCSCCGFNLVGADSERNGDLCDPQVAVARRAFDWRNSTTTSSTLTRRTLGTPATATTTTNMTSDNNDVLLRGFNGSIINGSRLGDDRNQQQQRTQARKLNQLAGGKLLRESRNHLELCVADYHHNHNHQQSSSCYNSSRHQSRQSLLGDKNLVTLMTSCCCCCCRVGDDCNNYYNRKSEVSGAGLSRDNNAKIGDDTCSTHCCCWCQLKPEYRAWLTGKGRDLSELRARNRLQPPQALVPSSDERADRSGGPRKVRGDSDSAARIMSSLSTSSLSFTMDTHGDKSIGDPRTSRQMIISDAINSNHVTDNDGGDDNSRADKRPAAAPASRRPLVDQMDANESAATATAAAAASDLSAELAPIDDGAKNDSDTNPRNDGAEDKGATRNHDKHDGQCKTGKTEQQAPAAQIVRNKIDNQSGASKAADRIIVLPNNESESPSGAAPTSGAPTGCRCIQGEILFIVMEKYASLGESFTKSSEREASPSSSAISSTTVSSASASRSASPSEQRREDATATTTTTTPELAKIRAPQVVAGSGDVTDSSASPQSNQRKVCNDALPNLPADDNGDISLPTSGQRAPKLSQTFGNSASSTSSASASSDAEGDSQVGDTKTANVMMNGDNGSGGLANDDANRTATTDRRQKLAELRAKGSRSSRGDKVAEFCMAAIVIDELNRVVQLRPDLNQLVSMERVCHQLSVQVAGQISANEHNNEEDHRDEQLARASSSWSLTSSSTRGAPRVRPFSLAPSNHRLYYRLELPAKRSAPLVSVATSPVDPTSSQLANIKSAERELDLVRKLLRSSLEDKGNGGEVSATGFLSPINGSVLVNLQLDIHFASEFPANCRNLYVNYKVMARNKRHSGWRLRPLKATEPSTTSTSTSHGITSANDDCNGNQHYDQSTLHSGTRELSVGLRGATRRQSSQQSDDTGMTSVAATAATAAAPHDIQRSAPSSVSTTAANRSVDTSAISGDVGGLARAGGTTNGDNDNDDDNDAVVSPEMNERFGGKLEQPPPSKGETMSHPGQRRQQMAAETSLGSAGASADRLEELDAGSLASHRKRKAQGDRSDALEIGAGDDLDDELTLLHEASTVTSWPDARGRFHFSCLEQLTLELRQVASHKAGKLVADLATSGLSSSQQEEGGEIVDQELRSREIIEMIKSAADGDLNGGNSSVNNERNTISATRGSGSSSAQPPVRDFSQKIAKSVLLSATMSSSASGRLDGHNGGGGGGGDDDDDDDEDARVDEISLDMGNNDEHKRAAELTRFGHHQQQVGASSRKQGDASRVAHDSPSANRNRDRKQTPRVAREEEATLSSSGPNDVYENSKGLAQEQQKRGGGGGGRGDGRELIMTNPIDQRANSKGDPGADSVLSPPLVTPTITSKPTTTTTTTSGNTAAIPCELVLQFEFYSRDFYRDKPRGFAHFNIPVSPHRIGAELRTRNPTSGGRKSCATCANQLRTRSSGAGWRQTEHNGSLSSARGCRCKCTATNKAAAGANLRRFVHEIAVIRQELQAPMDRLRYYLIGQLPESAPTLDSLVRSRHRYLLHTRQTGNLTIGCELVRQFSDPEFDSAIRDLLDMDLVQESHRDASDLPPSLRYNNQFGRLFELKETGKAPLDSDPSPNPPTRSHLNENLDIDDVVEAYRRAKERISQLNIGTMLAPMATSTD